MRLTEVSIDQFGVWRDLDIPLNDSGVSVFYGPNEAGKSTLMRFVRGVLYGFPNNNFGQAHHGQLRTEASGELHIVHEGRRHIIRREAKAGERGRVRFDDLDGGAPSEARVRQVVRDVNESLFENIFAIGLSELQELATLDASEVADQIYGLSLGPEGESILQAHAEFARQRQRLVSDDHKAGEVVKLAKRLEELDSALAEIGDVSRRHSDLRVEQDRLHGEIEQREAKRADLQHELRGRRYLDRVHGPWKRERQLRAERDALPTAADLPDDLLIRFDQLEQAIAEHGRRREGLIQRCHDAVSETDSTIDPEVVQHESAIRRLADHRDELGRRRRRLHEKEARLTALQQKFQERLKELGPEWSAARIAGISHSSAGLSRLWDTARRYQTAVTHRNRSVKRYRKLVASSQKRQAEFNERIKLLGSLTLSQAVHAAQQRLHEVRELSRLRVEELKLTAQAVAARGRVALRSEIRELPPLFYVMMWFFTIAGSVLFFAGLWGVWANAVAGGNAAWIIGLAVASFGLCMAGTSWTVKQHLDQYFDSPGDSSPDADQDGLTTESEPQTLGQNLARVRQAIRDIVGTPPATRAVPTAQGLADSPEAPDEADVLVRAAQRLAELEELQREEHEIQTRRQRLTRYRTLLRERNRIVSQRRRAWCDALRDLQMSETLKVDAAFTQWQSLSDALHLRRAAALLEDDLSSEQRSVEELQRQCERLMRELPQEFVTQHKSDMDQLVAHWRGIGQAAGGARGKKKSQPSAPSNELRTEWSALDRELQDLYSRRCTLLVRAGVTTRDELAKKVQSALRRNELSRLIEQAAEELEIAAAAETDLAIVEEDLHAFDPLQNKQAIEKCEQQCRQIERELQVAHEHLGRLKRDLQEIARDRRAVSLRFEREQVAAELARQMDAWCALELATDAIEHVRHRLERHAQSEALQMASNYLDRLTGGKYPNIWCPLGERHLCIDDDSGETRRIEQLSTGTREQLFLALRLAMIRRFANDGVELPLVLDDVFVNFDQTRTEAAVETILDCAEQGQQVLLFTCHLHLAHMFESKGIDPVWLPVNAAALEKRRAG